MDYFLISMVILTGVGALNRLLLIGAGVLAEVSIRTGEQGADQQAPI